MNTECTHALELLQRSLETGAGLDPEACAHLETCSVCRANLGAALRDLAEPAAPRPPLNTIEVEAEVRARYRRRLVTRGLSVAGLLGAGLLGWLWHVDAIRNETVLAVVVLGALVPQLLLAVWLVRLPARHGLYKRLCKGRQLSGVCLGLAQCTRTPPILWRLGFLALFLLPSFQGAGVWIYALLALAMPVHPEDRSGLFRYRVARWWRGLRTKKALTV